jgi:hypothetical protein
MLVLCGVLWLATVLVSDVSIVVVTAFWLGAGVVLHFWIKADTDNSPWAPLIRSALSKNEAEIYEVRASGFLEYEPVDDEGPRYAFQIDSNQVLFIDGEVFVNGARFPSYDFNIVHALGEDGKTRAEWIENRGPRTEATGIVRAPLHAFPGHLDIVDGRLSEIEKQQLL